jgi:hypothetical protein
MVEPTAANVTPDDGSLSGPWSSLLPRTGLGSAGPGNGIETGGVGEMARGAARRGYLSCDQHTACHCQHRRCALPGPGSGSPRGSRPAARATTGSAAMRASCRTDARTAPGDYAYGISRPSSVRYMSPQPEHS